MAIYQKVKGSVGYTIVGSPTIVDGVVSGFSTTSRIKITQPFVLNGTPFEIVIKCTTGSTIIDYTYPFAFQAGDTASTRYGLNLCLYNGYFRTGGSLDGTSWVSSDWQDQNICEAEPNKTYKFRWVSTGTKWFMYYTAEGGQETLAIEYTLPSTPNFTATNCIFGSFMSASGTYATGFDGSIDLNETYIKVNDKPWFGLCPIEVKKHQVRGPVGYSLVGSPTVTDGVLSGFSANNYAVTTSNLPHDTEKLEVYSVFTTPTDLSSEQMIWWVNGNPIEEYSGDYGVLFGFQINPVNGHNFYMYANIDTQGISYRYQYANFLVQANTTYALHAVLEGDTVEWELGEPGNLITQTSLQYGNPLAVLDQPLKMGHLDNNTAYYFKGSIDLNKSWIKVNDKLWYWQPQETKKIVVNGVKILGPDVWYSATGSQHLYLNNAIDFHSADTWEIRSQFVYVRDTDGRITGQNNNNSSGYYFAYPVLAFINGKFALWLSSDERSSDIASYVTSQFTASKNVVYDVSLEFTGTQYILKYKEKDANSWNIGITVNSSSKVYSNTNFLMELCNQGNDNHVQAFGGSLNITSTTIKLDGVTVFNGATAVEGVDYTNVGCTESLQ